MMMSSKVDEAMKYQFNEGRIHADRKWIEAIDRRIAELELQVGIPELRRLKKLTMYRWNNSDDNDDKRRKNVRTR